MSFILAFGGGCNPKNPQRREKRYSQISYYLCKQLHEHRFVIFQIQNNDMNIVFFSFRFGNKLFSRGSENLVFIYKCQRVNSLDGQINDSTKFLDEACHLFSLFFPSSFLAEGWTARVKVDKKVFDEISGKIQQKDFVENAIFIQPNFSICICKKPQFLH